MKQYNPLVSICIPTYNYGHYLPQAIESCLKQTYANIEVVVVDNASTDGSVGVLEKFYDPRLRFFVNQTQLEFAANWNKALAKAYGDIVKLLCADDFLASNAIARIVDIFQDESIALVFNASVQVDGTGNFIRIHSPYKGDKKLDGKEEFKQCIRRGNYIGDPSAVALRASVLVQVGPFNESLAWQVDQEMWLRALLKGDAYFISEPLTYTREHEKSETNRLVRTGRIHEETLKAVRHYLQDGIISSALTEGDKAMLVSQYGNLLAEDICRKLISHHFHDAYRTLRAVQKNSVVKPPLWRTVPKKMLEPILSKAIHRKNLAQSLINGRATFVKPTIFELGVRWLLCLCKRRDFRLIEAPVVDGLRLHIGAGQNILEGYENLDAYDNSQRPTHFRTPVKKFVRAELLDTVYKPETVAEIRCHHMFEHISILDVDRTLQAWSRIMKFGGLLWIEVPDFEGCIRKILRLKREEDKEIFYRHIFGSQIGYGEYHYNGFTAKRLMKLAEDYGFEIKLVYIEWKRRKPRKPDMFYPSDFPLPDLTLKAIKVGPPKPVITQAEWTHIAYRKQYPHPDFPPLKMGL